MMHHKKRYTYSFFLTILLYVSVAGATLLFLKESFATPSKRSQHRICISLNEVVIQKETKPTQTMSASKPKKQKTSPKEQKKPHKTKKIQTKKIEPKKKPKPKKPLKKRAPKKTPQKKSQKESKEQQKTPTKAPIKPQANPINKPVQTKKSPCTKKIAPKKSTSLDKATLQKQQRFIQKLIQAINENKYYPRRAQRRGIEGDVKVRFTILQNGAISNITILESKAIFQDATIEAIEAISPIKTKNSGFSFPKSFSITLSYRLY